MRAGRLRHPITILHPIAETVSPTGEVRKESGIYANVYAEIVTHVASTSSAGPVGADTRTVLFRIRHVPGLSTGFQIMHGGVLHDLKEIVEIENGRGLELRAVATS